MHPSKAHYFSSHHLAEPDLEKQKDLKKLSFQIYFVKKIFNSYFSENMSQYEGFRAVSILKNLWFMNNWNLKPV